jgi:hypothetical protein
MMAAPAPKRAPYPIAPVILGIAAPVELVPAVVAAGPAPSDDGLIVVVASGWPLVKGSPSPVEVAV